MLLNLSNHPVATWQEKQVSMALEAFGAIEDMPFPSIPSEWDTEQVLDLATSYCQQILNWNPQAVHLMGELTFCVALVPLLQEHQILCLASTSERLVTEHPDGKKTVTFNFTRFREYPRL